MKTLVCIMCIMLLAGCASVSYQTADGTKVTYTRFLTTSDSIEAKVGEATVKANGQKIDIEAVAALLGAVAKGAK
jgi:hypothetical protein